MTILARDVAALGSGARAPRREVQADTRYSTLLGEKAWARLPEAVRRRFSKPGHPGNVTIYRGQVISTELSRIGSLLAQAARLVGGPLPLTPGGGGTVTVTVIEDPAFKGQVWSRSYARAGHFPQVIHSAKRFLGPTGLEEYLGWGLVMRLGLSVEEGTLVFRSLAYGLELRGRFFRLPSWITPGTCEVRHEDQGGGRFRFELTLVHPLVGCLVRQVAVFEDPR
ncbi:MAG TPA: DUF4166 domain-containing protein [Hyphomicrobiaceae bacterium]|nr:DUF4166 domain-containing protein [Hyphomicrobiaceae bacterium]